MLHRQRGDARGREVEPEPRVWLKVSVVTQGEMHARAAFPFPLSGFRG